MKCQSEPVHKNLNFNIDHHPSQPYGSNTQFEHGGSKCRFEPVHKHSNRDGFKFKLLQGRRAPEFEPLMENKGVESENGAVDAKNKKTYNNRAMNKEQPEPAKRFSNHIEFIDYIPTHEVITYRHLFAYGFYVQ